MVLQRVRGSRHGDIIAKLIDNLGICGDIIVMTTVIFTSQAAKDFDALSKPTRIAIAKALDDYAMKGEGDIKKLSGRDGYRLRIGAYRVIFSEDATTILTIY